MLWGLVHCLLVSNLFPLQAFFLSFSFLLVVDIDIDIDVDLDA